MGTAFNDTLAKDVLMKESIERSPCPSQIPIKIDMKKPDGDSILTAQSIQSQQVQAQDSVKSSSSPSEALPNGALPSNKDCNEYVTLSSSKCQCEPIKSKSENCTGSIMTTPQKRERRVPKTMSCGANFPNTFPSQQSVGLTERKLKSSASTCLKKLEDVVPEFQKLLKTYEDLKSILSDKCTSEKVRALACVGVDSPKTTNCHDSTQEIYSPEVNNNDSTQGADNSEVDIKNNMVMVTPTWDSEERPNMAICHVSHLPLPKNKKRSRPLRRNPSEECRPPKVIPLGTHEKEETPNSVIATPQQTCQTVDKVQNADSRRRSSFQAATSLNSPQPSRDSSKAPSRETSFLRDGRKYGDLILERENALKSRRFYSSTYEGMFYRKKAFSKGRTPTYGRSPSSTPKHSSSFANDAALFQAEQRFTKIITQTKTEEYEEIDDGGGGGKEKAKKKTPPKKSTVAKTIKDPTTPSTKSITVKKRSKSPVPKVIIKAKPTPASSSAKKVAVNVAGSTPVQCKSSTCKGKEIVGTFVEGKVQKNSTQKKLNSNKALIKGKQGKSKIPRRLVLPGHGDPHMEIPDVPSRKSDLSKASGTEVKSEPAKRCSCEKCKVYKNLLHQSESTVRYLTQILLTKDREINTLKDICGSSLQQSSTDASKDASTPINPLLKKAENTEDAADPDLTTRPNEKPRARSDHGTAIPQFDLDEFIRKYFKQALHIKDFPTKNNEPFATEQLLRVAISARDCMAQIVRHKLKHANNHLKQKYDTLASMKSSSSFEESAYFSVLDSYRRFLRYIYFYWKESMKKVENFELSCITQSQNEIFDRSTKRKQIVYWHDTCLEIDGKKFSGTFIPFRDVTEEEKETCDVLLEEQEK